MKLVLLGAPGAGKGTQTRNLSKHYSIAQISTGDILRDNMRRKTKIGIEINDLMNKGQLVDDQLVINLVKERILEKDCENGFILDGFPRTIYQAKQLFDIVGEINKVVSVEVDDEVILERMTGRLTCSSCGAMYHTHYYPPHLEKICDVCSTELTQREDDKAKTVIERLRLYHALTEPIKEFFKEKNLLIEVLGVGDIIQITNFIVKALGEDS
jgi:adenylate kinase